MPEIELAEQQISYEVRHSDRASKVRIDAGIEGFTVVIPNGMDLEPEEVLRVKKFWVLDKKRKHDKYREKIPDRNFEEGVTFPYLGEPHEVTVERARGSRVEEGKLVLAEHHVENTGIRRQLENLYRRKAKERINAKIDAYIDRVDGTFDKLYIRNQKTRWGSCSGRDNLSFNWRLIMAPDHVLEYVVVHELVHLEHRDHSNAFWRRVNELCPGYREAMNWLKGNAHELVFDRREMG